MRNEKLLPCPLCGHVAFNGGGVMGASCSNKHCALYDADIPFGQWKYWPEKATCKCDTEPMKTGIHWGLWRQGKFPLMYQCKKKNCWRKAFRDYCKLW